MKPEDLVGRRIRFLPRKRGCVYGTQLEGVSCYVTAAKADYENSYQLHLDRNGKPLWQTGIRLGLDFEVVDDGEIPYSWRV